MPLPRKILTGMMGGSALMVLFALVMLIKGGPLAAVPLPLAALLLAWVARKYTTTFAGFARGAINGHAVVIEPSALGPLRLPGPVGTYRLDEFKAVRVIYSGPVPRGSGGYLFANVYLIGRGSIVDVCGSSQRDPTAKGPAPRNATARRPPPAQEG